LLSDFQLECFQRKQRIQNQNLYELKNPASNEKWAEISKIPDTKQQLLQNSDRNYNVGVGIVYGPRPIKLA